MARVEPQIAVGRQRLGAALRRELAVTVTESRECTLKLTLLVSGRTARTLGLSRAGSAVVGRAEQRMRDRSRATVRVEFTKRARRKLADVRELTLRVRATATYPDGITADLGTKRTTLRR